MQNNKLRQLVIAAMFTALTAVASQIVIPTAPVPFSFSLVAVYLTGAILDKRYALLSMITYVLLGLVGAPVFAGFSGGLHKVLGPTGGYILSYPLVALLVSYLSDRWGRSVPKYAGAMGISLLVCYLLGTIQLIILTKVGIWEGLMAGVIPFIPLDIVKVFLSAVVAVSLNRVFGKEQHTFR